MGWTFVMDMHSGGKSKSKWEYFFIEGDEDNARRVLEERTGCDPDGMACDCCGYDFSYQSFPTLDDAVAAQVRYSNAKSVSEYLALPDVLVIRATATAPGKEP